MPMFEDRPIPNLSLSARNVVWVMLFSPFLEEAAISCDVSSEDLDFLVEYRLIFNDLSKVKRLAICFRFVCKESDQSTWWGSPSEQNFKIGNKKTASFRSTRHLRVFSARADPRNLLNISARCVNFKNLRVLAIEGNPLNGISRYPESLAGSRIQILCLSFFGHNNSFPEEKLLGEFWIWD